MSHTVPQVLRRLAFLLLLPATLLALLPASAAATPPGSARHILDLEGEAPTDRLLLDWGDYRIDTTGSRTLAEMLADRASFKPTRSPESYRLRPGEALWILFAVPATPEDARWYVKLPAAGIDHAELYTQQADRSWARQEAGDSIPASAWPIPHLYPVLPLSVSAADPTFYALRIETSEGFFAPIEFVNESRLSSEIQRLSLIHGAYLGLLAMGAVFALAMSVALRDRAYLWFGLWAAATLFAMMADTGIAGLHLWPQRPSLNETMPYALPVVAAAALAMFVAEALLVLERFPSLYGAAAGTAAVSGFLAAGIAAGFWMDEWRLWVALGGSGLSLACALGVAAWSIRRRDPFSWRVLVALTPILLALPFCVMALLQSPLTQWPESFIAFAALGLSVPGSYLVLALRSQERRDHRTRISRLAQIDPTTGLINEVVFASRLRELTTQSERLGHQSFVALVDFGNLEQLRAEFGRKRALELLLRLADRLTSMLRNVDTVGRMGDARFGILVEGPLAASRTRAFGSKIIAHCITPLSGMPQGMVVRPKVALAMVPQHGTDPAQLIAELETLLADMQNDTTRSMAIIDQAPSRPSPLSSAGPDTISSAPTQPAESITVTQPRP